MTRIIEPQNQIQTIKPVTKHQRLVLNAEDIPEAVHEAMEQLKTGRPRPVEIEIPPETLYDVADIELLDEGKLEELINKTREQGTNRREDDNQGSRRNRYESVNKNINKTVF